MSTEREWAPLRVALAGGGVGLPGIRRAREVNDARHRAHRCASWCTRPGRPPHRGARTAGPGCAHLILGARTQRTACPSRYAPFSWHPEVHAPDPPSCGISVTCRTVRRPMAHIWDFRETEVKGVCDIGTSLDPGPLRGAVTRRLETRRAPRCGGARTIPHGCAGGARTGPHPAAPHRTDSARRAPRGAPPARERMSFVRSGPPPDVRHCIRCRAGVSLLDRVGQGWHPTGTGRCPRGRSLRRRAPSPASARVRRPWPAARAPGSAGERSRGRRTGTDGPYRLPACTRSGTPPRCRRPVPRRPSSTTS